MTFLVLVFLSSESSCVSFFVCLVHFIWENDKRLNGKTKSRRQNDNKTITASIGRIIEVDSGTALKRAGRSNYLGANEVRHRFIAGFAKSRLRVKKRQMQAYKKW